jgi:hypothetical protein
MAESDQPARPEFLSQTGKYVDISGFTVLGPEVATIRVGDLHAGVRNHVVIPQGIWMYISELKQNTAQSLLEAAEIHEKKFEDESFKTLITCCDSMAISMDTILHGEAFSWDKFMEIGTLMSQREYTDIPEVRFLLEYFGTVHRTFAIDPDQEDTDPHFMVFSPQT